MLSEVDKELEYGDSGAYGRESLLFKRKKEIHWQVAMDIFEEVNLCKNQQSCIDLNCQPVPAAIAITKQKIYDLAEAVRNQSEVWDWVLAIQTAEGHMMSPLDAEYSVPQTPIGNAPQVQTNLKNVLHGLIKHELRLDHFYIPQQRVVLVRITPDTFIHLKRVMGQW